MNTHTHFLQEPPATHTHKHSHLTIIYSAVVWSNSSPFLCTVICSFQQLHSWLQNIKAENSAFTALKWWQDKTRQDGHKYRNSSILFGVRILLWLGLDGLFASLKIKHLFWVNKTNTKSLTDLPILTSILMISPQGRLFPSLTLGCTLQWGRLGSVHKHQPLWEQGVIRHDSENRWAETQEASDSGGPGPP